MLYLSRPAERAAMPLHKRLFALQVMPGLGKALGGELHHHVVMRPAVGQDEMMITALHRRGLLCAERVGGSTTRFFLTTLMVRSP